MDPAVRTSADRPPGLWEVATRRRPGSV